MLLGSMVACGGSSKTAVTAADFIKAAQDNGMTVTDENANYTDEIFTDVQSAVHPDGWTVMFLTIDTAEHAKEYFATCKAFVESQKTGTGSAQTTERDTWAMYKQTNGGKYGYVSQIDTTLIYAFVDEAHKDAVTAFTGLIGY